MYANHVDLPHQIIRSISYDGHMHMHRTPGGTRGEGWEGLDRQTDRRSNDKRLPLEIECREPGLGQLGTLGGAGVGPG